MRSVPWPEKYRPVTTSQIVGNEDARTQLNTWIKSWSQGIPSKRAVLLLGPPGVGKTTTIYALANDLNMELVEFNASDRRNKEIIERVVWRSATQETLDGRKRIILLEEVDGLSGTGDRGGAGAIAKIARETIHPLVMTANDPTSPRLKDLEKISIVITFESISFEDILTVLKRILKDIGSQVNEEVIARIADRANGDLRGAIADLETIIEGESDKEGIIGGRNSRASIEHTLKRIFMSTDPGVVRQVLNEADSDQDELLLWLEENLHLHLTDSTELAMGYEALSLADQILGRIMNRQNWKLLSYFYDYIAMALAPSRIRTPFKSVKYKRPSWPLIVWKGSRSLDKKTPLLSSLSELTSVSRYRIPRTYTQYIEQMCKRDQINLTKIAGWLGIKSDVIAPRIRSKAK
ncbi:MAG: replication factor C large subunit [Candidatus Thorarchaeota archaeon]